MFCPACNLCAQTWRLQGLVDPDCFVSDVGGTIPLHPNGYLLSHLLWLLPSSNLVDSLKDLALESVRMLEKIILLHSCAHGEALAI